MDKPILLDTDVMIDFLRGHPKAVALIEANSSNLIFSAIVVAELYAGIRNETELQTLDSFIALFKTIPVSADLARQGGLYKNKYAKSHGIGLADAIIAASVKAEQAELKTLNTKHYPMFKGLKPPYRKA